MKHLEKDKFQPSRPWLAPLIGAFCGVLYGLLDFYLDHPGTGAPSYIHLIHELFDVFLPIALGIAVGLGINLILKNIRFNQYLSMKNSQLSRSVFTSTLISYIIHELRNPIHNLSAALENNPPDLTKEQESVVHKNLKRLESITTQWANLSVLYDTINPKETVLLKEWFQRFFNDKVSNQLREMNIQYSQIMCPAEVYIHPTLLEQICVTLFSNAIQELGQQKTNRVLTLTIDQNKEASEFIEIKLTNPGSFPDEVIKSQGKQVVNSRKGLGLGLVIVQKTLTQIGGSLQLFNTSDSAVVKICIPGALV